jgi:hypothetical protein
MVLFKLKRFGGFRFINLQYINSIVLRTQYDKRPLAGWNDEMYSRVLFCNGEELDLNKEETDQIIEFISYSGYNAGVQIVELQ